MVGAQDIPRKQGKNKSPEIKKFQGFAYMVRLAGIEPTTPWFVAKYSIQLSYSRKNRKFLIYKMVGAAGFELATLCSQSRCATRLRYAPTRPRVYNVFPLFIKIYLLFCPAAFCSANRCVNSCAETGRQYQYPCPKSHPASSKIWCCSWVSTPSATT